MQTEAGSHAAAKAKEGKNRILQKQKNHSREIRLQG